MSGPVTRHDLTGECGDPPATKPKQEQQPSIQVKYALKKINFQATMFNAILDSYMNNRELYQRFLYPLPEGSNRIYTSAFHGTILSKVAASAVFGGVSGSIYSAMSIKKEGLNRGNGFLLFGNLNFIAEGVMLYAAMAAIGHHAQHQFHTLTRRANIFGTIADSSKAYSYFYNAEYLKAAMFVFLAAGNAIPLTSDKTRRSAVKKLMRIAPPDIGKIKFIARSKRPRRCCSSEPQYRCSNISSSGQRGFLPQLGKKSGSGGSHD